MALETGTYISDLVATNPVGSTDAKSTLDDHIRFLKSTIKTTFANISGAVTASHTELNYVAGVTSAIQTQLNAKSPLAGSSSIVTVGTITAGVWNGTAIGNSYLANSSITVNGTSISLGGSGTATAAAGTLTGNTLASGVTASSLTSVGTLTSLTTSGAATIGGTLGITNAQSAAAFTLATSGSNAGSPAYFVLDTTASSGGGSIWRFGNTGAVSGASSFSIYNQSNNKLGLSITPAGVVSMPNLPTSSAGLSSGDIWNDAGTLKVA